ncbi:WD40 repeat-like protein, partial [Myriangium duriaei CBS 260.36]
MSPVLRHDSIETTHTQEEPSHGSNAPSPPRPALRTDTGSSKPHKSKDHRVSFFSRIMGGKKKENHDTIPDDASISEQRPEGHDAEVFSPIMRHTEFGLAQPQIPNYIRVRTRHSRKRKHFDTLFLAQELMGDNQPLHNVTSRRRSAVTMPDPDTAWAAEFSKDGKYLATAGNDKIVRIWAVISTPEERQSELRRSSDSSAGAVNTAAIFHSRPIREYRGHSSTILDLSWSKNNFLLSSSMDKTVRLWHVTRAECLCTFKHSDYVPTICFHPKDDRFFLAGSLDCKLRLWSIPEKHVAYWSQLPNMITAVSFTPDGKHAIAGCSDGSCLFYETEGMRYQTQVRVKSAQSKHAQGAKITGIHSFQHPPNTSNGDTKLLITSNDSRVRLYNFRDKSLEMKMKGTVNNSCQIRASLSDDGRYICCGSEDKRAYLWPLDFLDGEDPSKRPVEHFQAHDSMVTCVRFAPAKTRNLLARSSDPIFDLCCPPSGTSTNRDGADSESSSRNATEAGGSSAPSLVRHKSESPSRTQQARCSHHSGNIIVTASQTGTIKVFRQDCAAKYRLPRSNSYKRLSSLHLSKHSNSLRNKRSAHSLQSGRDSTSTQAPSDRILSWRQ